MFTLLLISTVTNLSDAWSLIFAHRESANLVCSLLGILVIIYGSARVLFKPINDLILKNSIPKDADILVEYNEYFTGKELEKLNVPYVQRTENGVERDVIKEAIEFIKSSEQVLIISGESGIGKTRLAIEISKKINGSE